MSVAIIGAGMTGLLAAKACMDKGIMPTILSATKPNPGHGVRYLHDNCGLPLKPMYALRHFAPHCPFSFKGRSVSMIWT